ncbi:hypothetical protein QAD02_008795 [Eretmocerus hayati]|uniref:Uncharacterized protein n=1 Tax=Eretmocerus hayati TaxID=131215 RepID=A0ACC2N7L2_9HYME|nr:hypothetical protein QAD02_008795 [Eretmocerus hayati]
MFCSTKKNEASSSGKLHQLCLNEDDRRELRDLVANVAADDDEVRGLLEHIDDELTAPVSEKAEPARVNVDADEDWDELQDDSENHFFSIRMADRGCEVGGETSSGSKLYSVMRFGHHERGCEASAWRGASLQQTTSCGGRLKLRVKLQGRDESGTSNDITFRGSKQAGIDQHSSYYLLMPRAQPDGNGGDSEQEAVLEAHPLHHWYTFRAEQRYNSLSAEQAEAEFARRDSILNYFSLMASCRAPNSDATSEASNVEAKSQHRLVRGTSSGPSALRLRIGYRTRRIKRIGLSAVNRGTGRQQQRVKASISKTRVRRGRRQARRSDDASASDGEDEEEEFDEAEDSVGIMSSSSSDDDDELAEDEMQEQQVSMVSVADEGGLADMLISSDSDPESDESAHHNNETHLENRNHPLKQLDGHGSAHEEFSCVWGHFDGANEGIGNVVAGTSDAVEKILKKRKLNYTPNISRLKRRKLYAPSPPVNATSECCITVESVRRYLLRKPITVKDLLKKFKLKKTGLSKEETEELLMLALAELNPDIQEINGATYYSLDLQ